MGQKGTIIGIHHITDKNPVRQGNVNKYEDFYDILFDKPFDGGIPYPDINESCVARISKVHLINLSRNGGKKLFINGHRIILYLIFS